MVGARFAEDRSAEGIGISAETSIKRFVSTARMHPTGRIDHSGSTLLPHCICGTQKNPYHDKHAQ